MQSPNEVVLKAAEIATELHAGQKDKAGFPYILHPQRVAEMVRLSGGNWAQEAAAWLHDVLEDTTCTSQDLLRRDIPAIVVSLVEILTKRASEPTETYLLNVHASAPACEIKVCDIHDNLSPVRLCYLPLSDQARLRRKYGQYLVTLSGPTN